MNQKHVIELPCVEIFKTNVLQKADADKIINELRFIFPRLSVNFDLEDCDHILRIEGQETDPVTIEDHLRAWGFSCNVLL